MTTSETETTSTREPDTSRIRWSGSARLVPASYPPIRLFEDTASPKDLDTVLAVLRITDPQALAAAGDLALVAPEQRVSGEGSLPVMAAFTHLSPDWARFSDETVGGYYAARSLETAIEEVRFHQARRLAAGHLASTDVVCNVYLASVDARVHDVRGMRRRFPEAYVAGPVDYPRSQALARRLRTAGSSGIVYDSLLDEGGQCVALFSPRAVKLPVRQRGQVIYHWDGEEQRVVSESRRQ